MASTLYRTNGVIEPIQPHGAIWSLEELQGIVGGYIEIVHTLDGKFMVVNETGKVQNPPLPLNIAATRIYMHGRHDPIVGPALVVDTKLELDGPDEEEEFPVD
jgi:hypothetical protein